MTDDQAAAERDAKLDAVALIRAVRRDDFDAAHAIVTANTATWPALTVATAQVATSALAALHHWIAAVGAEPTDTDELLAKLAELHRDD